MATGQPEQTTHVSNVGLYLQTAFNIEPFDPTTNFKRQIQRLKDAFKVFKISEADYTPYLLHYIGSKAFEILCDKINPDDPYTKDYSTLKNYLKNLTLQFLWRSQKISGFTSINKGKANLYKNTQPLYKNCPLIANLVNI